MGLPAKRPPHPKATRRGAGRPASGRQLTDQAGKLTIYLPLQVYDDKMRPTDPTERYRFNVTDLSIVLVIIGLIVGGRWLGRDVIADAQLAVEKHGSGIDPSTGGSGAPLLR